MAEISNELLRARIDLIDGRLRKYSNWPIGTGQLHNLIIFPDREILPRGDLSTQRTLLLADRDLLNKIVEGGF